MFYNNSVYVINVIIMILIVQDLTCTVQKQQQLMTPSNQFNNLRLLLSHVIIIEHLQTNKQSLLSWRAISDPLSQNLMVVTRDLTATISSRVVQHTSYRVAFKSSTFLWMYCSTRH